MKKSSIVAIALVTVFGITACGERVGGGEPQPFHGEWVYERGGVERVVYTFEPRNVEMIQRTDEGEMRWHWKGTHSIQPIEGAWFEGEILWKNYFEFETNKWDSWDFRNDHDIRLMLDGEMLRFYTEFFGEWEEADYSPLVKRF